MFINKTLLFLFILINGLIPDNDFFAFRLSDLDNNMVSFESLKKNKATVIIFLLSDCPASQSYTLTLNKLSQKYKDNGIAFYGIFPGTFSSDMELKNFRTEYKITFPLLKDPEMKLAKNLKAIIAPECFLIGSHAEILYKGRIDDLYYTVGKKRQVIREHNLEDAIKSFVNNSPLKIKETQPIGCFLEY